MAHQSFEFSEELETSYPGYGFEVTVRGVVSLATNDDEWDELVSVSLNGTTLSPTHTKGTSFDDWQRFEHKCFAAARDAQYMEACKKERENNPENLKS